jgi:hypothetical protein
MTFAENHGTRIFDQILSSEGLAWIAIKVFDQLDGNTLKNCELICKLWRQFIIKNGQLWKRQYWNQLAKPGSDVHFLIKSYPELFPFNQGTFHIFCPAMSNRREIYRMRIYFRTLSLV